MKARDLQAAVVLVGGVFTLCWLLDHWRIEREGVAERRLRTAAWTAEIDAAELRFRAARTATETLANRPLSTNASSHLETATVALAPPILATSPPPSSSSSIQVHGAESDGATNRWGRIWSELRHRRVRIGEDGVADRAVIAARLRGLVEAGESAVPEVCQFLARFEEVEYPPDRPAAAAATRALMFEFPSPPTLRLGLLQVLWEIGTPAAEAGLVDVLRSTGRGVEVAWLARKLESKSPGRHRETALTAAKELLARPPALSGESRFDALQKAYLYSVLEFYHDSSFAGQTPRWLVAADGRLDREALSYLTKSMGVESSLPWLYQAFTNTALTDPGDRSRLLQTALPSADRDPYAQAMVRGVLGDSRIPVAVRGFVLQRLAESSSHGTVNPAALQAKLQFLDQLRGEFSDPVLSQSIERASREVDRQLRAAPRSGPRLH